MKKFVWILILSPFMLAGAIFTTAVVGFEVGREMMEDYLRGVFDD